MKRLNLIVLVIVSLCLQVYSQETFKLPEYEKHILPNGVTLYLMEQHEVPLIYISTLFPAGAVWDGEQNGLAAFTAEALLFGSRNYSKDEMEEAFDFLGAGISTQGGIETAGVDVYFKKNDMDELLPIFADVITNPTFSQIEFEKRQQRWIAELDQAKESPRAVIGTYFNKMIYNENPYGNPVNGTKKTIGEITVDDLRAFFGQHYQLSSACISVVGDFNTEDMKAKIESLFPSAPKMVIEIMPKAVKEIEEDFKRSNVLLVNKDDARETTFLIGGWGVAMNNPDIVELEILNTILGGRFTSWLNDELRVNSGLTYGARSRFAMYKNSGTFYMYTFTANETTFEAIDLALKTYNRLFEKGIDEETLKSAKSYVKGQFPTDYETAGSLADLLCTMHFYSLEDSYINDFVKKVDSITLERANELIDKYFPEENLQFVLIGKADELREQAATYGTVTEKEIKDNGF